MGSLYKLDEKVSKYLECKSTLKVTPTIRSIIELVYDIELLQRANVYTVISLSGFTYVKMCSCIEVLPEKRKEGTKKQLDKLHKEIMVSGPLKDTVYCIRGKPLKMYRLKKLFDVHAAYNATVNVDRIVHLMMETVYNAKLQLQTDVTTVIVVCEEEKSKMVSYAESLSNEQNRIKLLKIIENFEPGTAYVLY